MSSLPHEVFDDKNDRSDHTFKNGRRVRFFFPLTCSLSLGEILTSRSSDPVVIISSLN